MMINLIKHNYNLNDDKYNLIGGETEEIKDNKGNNSYCEIDYNNNNKFIKYYYTLLNEISECYEVIDDKIIKFKLLNEFEIYKYTKIICVRM